MSTFSVYLSAVLLAGLAIFQLALALGAPLGRFAWGGQHVRLPHRLRLGSLLAIVIYVGLLAIQVQRAGLLRLFDAGDWIDLAAWAVVVFYLLGVLANIASPSPLERLVMTPLVSLLCGFAVVIALGL